MTACLWFSKQYYEKWDSLAAILVEIEADEN